MNFKRIAAAAGAVLMISSNAFAAEVDVNKRKDDLNYLYDTLKEVHPNIFYNNDEEIFSERISEIEKKLPYDSDTEFMLDLQSLVSLVGDSHTSLTISMDDADVFPVNMTKYDGKWTLTLAPEEYKECVGMRVDTIAGYSVDALCQKFAYIFSVDNKEVLEYRFSKNFYVDDFLSYLGVKKHGEPLKIQGHDDNGKKYEMTVNSVSIQSISDVKLAKLSDMRTAVPATEYNGEYYSSKPLNNSAYYIQYNKCDVDPDFPIDKFEDKVKNELNSGNYSQIIIDIRNNGGGSDGVIQNTLKIIKDYADKNGSEIYGLIGERTFSSAIINSVMIKEMGGYLVGVPTGGSVNHFGAVKGFKLPNSGLKVGYSTKMIWLSDFMDAAQGYDIEALQPDLVVYESIEDYINGIDTVVETVLAKPEIKEYETGKQLYMTRGGLVTELYKLSGDSMNTYPDVEFYDVFPFSETYKPICWAVKNGIAVGDGTGMFLPAKKITREEAAVIIDRFLDYMKIEKTSSKEIAYEGVSDWASASVNNIVSMGIMETESGDFKAKDNITKDCGITDRVSEIIGKADNGLK